jgi:hypothetical protein
VAFGKVSLFVSVTAQTLAMVFHRRRSLWSSWPTSTPAAIAAFIDVLLLLTCSLVVSFSGVHFGEGWVFVSVTAQTLAWEANLLGFPRPTLGDRDILCEGYPQWSEK